MYPVITDPLTLCSQTGLPFLFLNCPFSYSSPVIPHVLHRSFLRLHMLRMYPQHLCWTFFSSLCQCFVSIHFLKFPLSSFFSLTPAIPWPCLNKCISKALCFGNVLSLEYACLFVQCVNFGSFCSGSAILHSKHRNYMNINDSLWYPQIVTCFTIMHFSFFSICS